MATVTRDLSDQVDGEKTTFLVPDIYVPGSLTVHWNGIREQRGVFFTERDPVSFETSEPPLLGDTLQVQYEVAGEPVGIPIVVASGIDPTRP